MDNQEKDFLDDIDVSYTKPKKQLSEQKLQHLQNIRVKALEKKKQMKEITEKANKLKELESLKEAKKIQKEQLAKKYDEMIEKQKVVREDLKGPPNLAEEVKPTATNFTLVGGTLGITNIRIWKESIEEEKQPIVLNQYVVRDSHLSLTIDNAIIPLRLVKVAVVKALSAFSSSFLRSISIYFIAALSSL
jgi:phenylalanyl-tRNA synthetase alpha subunit